MSRELPKCDLCGYDRPHDRPHDEELCRKRELLRRREQVAKLARSVKDWTDAWYELREIIADLSWRKADPPTLVKRAPLTMRVRKGADEARCFIARTKNKTSSDGQ